MSLQPADELVAGRQRLETLAANASTVIWHTEPDGSVDKQNPSWSAFTGQPFERYRGWGWLQSVHPEDRERLRQEWERATGRHEAFESHYRLRRRDGEYRHMKAHGTPVFDGAAVVEWVGACIDITASRAAEQALRESELRLRFLDELGQATRSLEDPAEIMQLTARRLGEYLDATRCAYADFEPDGRRFTVRSDWCVPGVASTAGEYALQAFGARASHLLARGEPLIVRDVDADLADDGGAATFKAIGIRATICASLAKQGRPVAMMAVHQSVPRDWTDAEIALVSEVVERCWAHIERVRDLQERRLAMEELQASRLKLEMGIQAAGLVMAEIDYRSNQNHISKELAQLLELADHDIVVPRQAIFDRIHPEDRQRYLDAIARTVDPDGPTQGHLAITVRAQLPSNTVRWIHIRLQVIFSLRDGRLQPDKGICAARDVTVEVVSERKIRAAQRLAQAVIEGAGALVYAKDLQGRYILSNQSWRDVLGLPAEQVHGATDDAFFGADDARLMREHDEHVARTGERLLVEETVTLHGKLVTYRSSKFPLHDEQGEIYAVCGVSTDITDVVEADRRKDEFIATLAHELRNPLAPIRNALEILNRTPEMPASTERMRSIMGRQLGHMVRLIDDLLDVSRITRDKLQMRIGPTTLQAVVEHALEASRPAIDAAGHALELSVSPEPVPLEGDLTRLAQVVGNLLNNAAKYTPAGGRICLSARREGDEALIVVSDNGAGLSAHMLPHVFDLFSQVDRTIERSQGGLGIGLWLVKKLVELHTGRVEVASPGLGQGCTFTVRLPLQAKS